MEGNSSYSTNSTYPNLTTRSPDVILEQKDGLTLHVLSSAKTTVIIKCAVLLAISLTGVFGNTLTIFAIKSSPSLRTKSNMLILNQATANAFICGVQIPMFVVTQLYVHVFSQRPCNHQILVAVVFVIAKMGPHVSMCNLIPVAVDRYIAICYPFFYGARVTETTIKKVIIAVWSYGLLVVIAFFVWLKNMDWTSCSVPYSIVMNATFDTVVYLSVSVTMVVVYGTIFRIALAQRRKVWASERWHDTQSDKRDPQSRPVGSGQAAAGDQTKKESSQRREFKAARLTAALLFSVIVMWLPHHVARCLQASGNTAVATQNLQDIGISLGLVNAATDWVIYGVLNTQFRNAFARILRIKTDQRGSST